MPKKILFTLAALLFLLTPTLVYLKSSVNAASLTSLSDTLTRLQKGELSSHRIQFTLPASEALNENESITYNFGEDDSKWSVDGINSTTNDFSFSDGAERNIVGIDGDCTDHNGPNDVVIEVNGVTGLVTVSPCENFVSSLTGATIMFKIGAVAGGADRIRNTNQSGSTIVKITHVNSANETNFGQLAVPIMEFDGVGISTQESISNPDILGIEKTNTAREELAEITLSNNNYVDRVLAPSDLGLITEQCFLTNFTSTIPSF